MTIQTKLAIIQCLNLHFNFNRKLYGQYDIISQWLFGIWVVIVVVDHTAHIFHAFFVQFDSIQFI